MSAAARAEARRKAILARGSDRLAKLTTSARGEDAPAYLHEDPPLANLPSMNAQNFLDGDSSHMPSARTSHSPSPSPQPARASTGNPTRMANIFEGMETNAPDPSVWGADQQQQFIQALMNASAGGALPQLSNGSNSDSPMPSMDNPFAALMGPQAGMGGGEGVFPPFGPGMGGNFPAAMEEPKEKSKLQKILPLLHLAAMWCLLGYFVLWAEPTAYRSLNDDDTSLSALGLWRRWAGLSQRSPLLGDTMQTFRIHVVPFFWAFTTLQIALHSLRIFSGFNSVQPPMLLSLALPHLPPPLPSFIVNSLKYMQMGSLFLDDLSGLIVGIGFIIYFSGWISQPQT